MTTTTTAPITTEQIREAIEWEAHYSADSERGDRSEFDRQVKAAKDGQLGHLPQSLIAWQKSVACRDAWEAVGMDAEDIRGELRVCIDNAILMAAQLLGDREAGKRAGLIAFAAKATEILRWVGRDGGEQ